jgi:GNAT superfamily N-acetyltransferase
MQLEEHADPSAFLDAAAPVLDADEARHNLIYGICSTLIDVPDAYPDSHLWTVTDGDAVGAGVLTPPFNVVVAKPVDDHALRFFAEELRARSLEIPGVTGAIPEVEIFAEAWSPSPRLCMRQGIYAAHAVATPVGVSGEPRPAGDDDRDLLVEWLRAFQEEALHEDAPHLDLEQVVERRLRRAEAGFGLWIDGPEPVSVCGYGGRTPHGNRIGPVYTPPDLRGRGYGSAVTARVTKEQLDGGRDYCFLYTDLSNPTSNKIYLNIGYEFVCDSAEYAFS